MSRLHRIASVPAGKTIADLLPALRGVTTEVPMGTPATECASCRKPFNAVRKRRKSIRLYPMALCQVIPLAFQYGLCGACFARYQRGGDDREAVLAAVDSYSDSEEATQ
ncbi:hypothetical protein [Accumulibacter sp.]|uniref:hypothetical protein n=1 Tax=Accumulibacter sp. TaxID=2053492 RepID=UPI002588F5AA|nr:hypothetical protein [Accumulibacter sp.]